MRRRTAIATAGALLTGSFAGCVDAVNQPATPVGSDVPPASVWTQIGGNAQHTRHVDARGPRDGAEIAWEALDRPVYPPVVDDALYLTEGWTDGAALSIGPDEGDERWTNDDLPPSRWAPALGEDHLFVLSRTEGNVVRLHALATETGEQSWGREDGITASSSSRPPSGPTIENGTVYLPSNRGVVAVDAATGDPEWEATFGPHVVDTDGPMWRTDWAKPTVTAGRVITFDLNDGYQRGREVYAVDTESGEPDWTAELALPDDWELKWRAVAGSGRVFVSALRPMVAAESNEESGWTGAERLFALEVDSGTVEWEQELTGKTLHPVAYAEGTLYVGEWLPEPDTGRLHALDAADGSVEWSYETDAGAVLSPTVAGDTVYVGQDESLVAVAREDGERRWELNIGDRPGPPVVVGDTAYVQTDPGHNYESRIVAVREP